MEYTGLTPVSRGLVAPSPSSEHLAAASGNCLDVYDLSTLNLLHTTTTSGPITHLAWAQNRPLLAAASTPPNTALILDATTGAVLFDIHETPLPIQALLFSPQATHLLQTVPHGLPATLHKLSATRRPTFLAGPAPGLSAYSPTSPHLAYLTSSNALHIVSLSTHTATSHTPNLHATTLHWTRAGLLLLGKSTHPAPATALSLYSTSGTLLMTGDPFSMHATRLEPPLPTRAPPPKFSAPPGHAAVAVNHAGTLAALAGHDGALRLVNLALWAGVAVLPFDCPVVDGAKPPVVFRETGAEEENVPGNGSEMLQDGRVCFEVVDCLAEPTVAVGGIGGKNGRSGLSRLAFSGSGRFLAARSETRRGVVFVWEVCAVRLAAVLILRREVRAVAWAPGEDRLAVVCGGEFVYVWREAGAAAVRVRDGGSGKAFCASKAFWGGDGKIVVVDGVGAKAFLVVYVS